mmetsp:Transcript_24423/g.33532  ORF Transcript_24423/g.33532 Transcript_24423/m.33532 type:complete len:1323 (+) Transcript_24423:115-4083(+)|eukprot:CAMPEP_0201493128 /NCGR_PEP_ID=MMETSP0151_2-20130828/36225_1 /ASSEMBLY_ACC=CAM_ASM_000257 /TAXON_ID=200890 /ORGANISM="Paramoeba atlantica, Strain 621/1 / CCAP 1560/9" /LENGTH=1322 /DNA_ID=CAMNT_0047880313 /DNA_START=115 /DNA_END=4083 /DNA_ORIENTATION=+
MASSFKSPSMSEPARKRKVRKVFFDNRRFVSNGRDDEGKTEVAKWRMKERMKTVGVALVCCLNIGVDPPDVSRTSPCARLECWLDPGSETPQKALEAIGNALQTQYERWQPRSRYKQCLDPTIDDVRKLCTSMRRSAKEERVLFHYNGHGVPKPTSNGEIWVFNKNYTQYIPLSIFELQSWMDSPSIYVFDCSAAGLILQWYTHFAEQRQREQGANLLANSIILGACAANETLPTNPQFPADVFTACLTTPIQMALRWFCSTKLNQSITVDLIDKIPGRLNDRRTILGQLNWIFTAITDTIAWNVLPPALFQRLFRQDLLVASLFRNFLLAERILRSSKCTPSSIPKIPSTAQHPMWRSWDLAADLCMSHLALSKGSPSPNFPQSSFFEDQLTAFEVWLQFASEDRIKQNRVPEQLPIVLQVLLSQSHRLRALVLLAEFLDLGVWAVNLALSVGIFPYVVKLLQSPASDLRQVLVFIWAKLLAIDKSCQLDLVKDNGHNYFLSILATPSNPSPSRSSSSSSSSSPSSPSLSSSSPSSPSLSSFGSRDENSRRFATLNSESLADDHTLAAFVLSVICDNCRPGQIACLSCGLLPLCLSLLSDAPPLLRCWLVFCLGKLWEDFEEAKAVAVRESAHERLCALLTDPVPEVRAATIFSIGTFLAGAGVNESRRKIELNLGLTLPVAISDASPLVRKELMISLFHLASGYTDRFHEAISEIHADQIELKKKGNKPKRSPAPLLGGESTSEKHSESIRGERQTGSVFDIIWKVMLSMRTDPFPEVSQMADYVTNNVLNSAGIYLNLPSITKAPCVCSSNSLGVPSTDSRPKSGQLKGRRLIRGLSSKIDDDEKDSPSDTSTDEARGPQAAFGNLLKRFGSDLPAQYTSALRGEDSNQSDSGHDRPGSYRVEPTPVEARSVLFSWACGGFSAPLLQPLEGDVTSPSHLRKIWRNKRKNEFLSEAIRMANRGSACCRRFEDQIAILDNSLEHTSHLLFHPFDEVLIACNLFDQIQVWSWKESIRTACFSNGNVQGTHLTNILLINDHDQPLVCTSASDGVVRVWDHPSVSNPADTSSYITGGKMTINSSSTPFSNVTPKLVTSFKGLTELSPSNKIVGNNMIVDWMQEPGLLLASGDVNLIRIWNIERELAVQEVSSGDACVVSLTNDAHSGRSIIAGCDDGSIRIFDSRSFSSRYVLSNTIQERRGRILKVHRSKMDNLLVAGSLNGYVTTWDLRRISQPLRTITCFKGDASCVAGHDFLPLFAVGSQSQKIKVYNFEGDELSMIRYHDGFLGQRIGPISCLAFHPYKPYLGAGARDSIVSIYGGRST